jgi:hypothetical protein
VSHQNDVATTKMFLQNRQKTIRMQFFFIEIEIKISLCPGARVAVKTALLLLLLSKKQ